MRASPGLDSAAPDPTVVVVRRHGLPRVVVWLLWLLGALLGSVVLGFLAGLARPREPDPWAVASAGPVADPETSEPAGTVASDPTPPYAETDD